MLGARALYRSVNSPLEKNILLVSHARLNAAIAVPPAYYAHLVPSGLDFTRSWIPRTAGC
uniref:Uncharacterized protein n=1 Tax=Aegilops tauschii subsp. strangulata TaxID=200361 RepID=A0A453QFP8_AEGTS